MIVASAQDSRRRARSRLPRTLFDYIDGGSYSEQTATQNMMAFRGIELRQRVMRDVACVDTRTQIFGQDIRAPIALGPVGMAGMFARRGEVQASLAAMRCEVPFCLSTVSICSIEEVVASGSAPPWMQLYMTRDRGFMTDLLARAQLKGCTVLVLTVDLPTPAVRYRDVRSGMYGGLSPFGELARVADAMRRPRWLWDVWVRGRPHIFGNVTSAMPSAKRLADFWAWVRESFDASVTWDDLNWIRSHWRGKIVIKGILDRQDAIDAVAAGADGVIVSNHGGRQLDGVLPSLTKLPAIADAVGDKTVIMVDGGIRSGLDVVKAVALGAKLCLLGRAWAFALADRGGPAVEQMLDRMGQELRTAMMLGGANSIDEIGPHMLEPRP